jgi:hypothetical protein
MAITTASQSQIGQETAKNSQVVTTAVKLVNSGASTGPTITSIIVTDSDYNNLSDTTVDTSNSFIKIIGTGFITGANVFIGSTQVPAANVTFTSSTELRIRLPVLTNNVNNTISLFNTNLTGTIFGSTLRSTTPPEFEYLVAAGGGGGGSANGGGGGGAGGLLTGRFRLVSGTTYTVTIGAGGTTLSRTNAGMNGANSVFGSITAIGGGGGGGGDTPAPGTNGKIGGSGGGGGSVGPNPGTAGSGTAGQGNSGGGGLWGSSPGDFRSGGGGGGAGQIGTTAIAVPSNLGTGAGSGGIGLQSNITGTNTYYAGGGGGGNSGNASAAGGLGGGGAGARSSLNGGVGTAGTINTGGGGGGGGGGSSGGTSAGGSGIVIVRFLDTFPNANVTGSPTSTIFGGYKIYTFTSSGSITLTV